MPGGLIALDYAGESQYRVPMPDQLLQEASPTMGGPEQVGATATQPSYLASRPYDVFGNSLRPPTALQACSPSDGVAGSEIDAHAYHPLIDAMDTLSTTEDERALMSGGMPTTGEDVHRTMSIEAQATEPDPNSPFGPAVDGVTQPARRFVCLQERKYEC